MIENHIDNQISSFQTYWSVETGCGPRHPTLPNPDLKKDFEEFIRRYPEIAIAKDYIYFLNRFSGLLLSDDESIMTLSLYGFDQKVALHLLKGEGNVVDQNGMLVIGDAVWSEVDTPKKINSMGFAFNLNDLSDKGPVYVSINSQPYRRFCNNFAEFLEHINKCEGNISSLINDKG